MRVNTNKDDAYCKPIGQPLRQSSANKALSNPKELKILYSLNQEWNPSMAVAARKFTQNTHTLAQPIPANPKAGKPSLPKIKR